LILLDASGLYAALDGSQAQHEAAERALLADPGPFVLSPFVLAELDYLIMRDLGLTAELAFLNEVAGGAYDLATLDADAVAAAAATARRYGDLSIGLTDASIVVLAGRHGTNRVLTLDERHFRALRTPAGEPFTILPADA
jgi:uncharacterized protein